MQRLYESIADKIIPFRPGGRSLEQSNDGLNPINY